MRDHCHYTGKYRGAAYQKSNLWYTIPYYVSVIFHNLSCYDTHLFIRELGKKFNSGSIAVIAENKEKYISFNVNVSVDRFMSRSLDSLSRNLVGVNGMVCEGCGSEAELTHISENYIAHGTCGKCQGASHQELEIDPIFDNLRVGYVDKQFRLLLRKGVYPYEYVDDCKKFKENHLPPVEVFYSKLNLS